MIEKIILQPKSLEVAASFNQFSQKRLKHSSRIGIGEVMGLNSLSTMDSSMLYSHTSCIKDYSASWNYVRRMYL